MDSRDSLRRHRSRSRSPLHSPSPDPTSQPSLMLLIPESLVSHFVNSEVTDHIQDESCLDRICIFEPDATTNEKIMALYSIELSNRLRAFHLVLNDFLTVEDFNFKEDGICILIPDAMVSLIIGRNGKQVKSLQEKSATNISVSDRKILPNERQVKICGRPRDIEAAVEEICKLVKDVKDRNFSPEPRNLNSPSRSQVRFIVPSKCAGILIGKNGLFTKQIRSEFDVEIRLIKGDRKPLR